MSKFTIELLLHIIGIGSASGLIFKNDTLYIISDNSNVLFEYSIKNISLTQIPLTTNPPQQNMPKPQKPDFEAITLHNDTLYVFGSGSTPNRNKLVTVPEKDKSNLKEIDLSDLYSVMQSFSQIDAAEFNIEGVVHDGESWYFFQRGNGPSSRNGIFTVNGNNFTDDFSILYNEVKLPKINGVRSTFTDAVFTNNTLYFLATAEDSKSVYHDGEVKGSLIGTFDLTKMKVKKTKKISDTQKFEGLTVFKNDGKEIEFLLCEDNDNDNLKSGIYKLRMGK